MRAGLTALALLLLGCEPAHGDVEIWRFAIEETPGSVQDAYAQRFAERLAELTDGAVRVIVYPYNTFITDVHIIE